MYHKRLKLMVFMMSVLLLTASPALAQEAGPFRVPKPGPLSVELILGWAENVGSEGLFEGEYFAAEGLPTRFQGSSVYGGSVMYRFPSGFALELSVNRLAMDLVDDYGGNYGTLNMTHVTLLCKFQGMPKYGTGLTWHADIGDGTSFNNIDWEIDTINFTGVLLELGAGLDYFFTKNISANLDIRFSIMWGDILLDTYNFKVLIGIRFWGFSN